MKVRVFTLAERPELATRWRELDEAWPAFIHFDPNGLFYRLPGHEPDTLVAVDERDEVVARAAGVRFRLPRTADGAPVEPPDDGLAEVVRWAAHDRVSGREPDVVATVEVTVHRRARGQGVGTRMLAALRDHARRRGFDAMLAPVRPVGKADEPHAPLAEYVARRREDGLPADPWLRTHVRLGGAVVRPAPYSTVVPGTLAQWRDLTGLPFDRSGPVVVPGALVPVLADLTHDYAVYVEPNVWVRHDLRARR